MSRRQKIVTTVQRAIPRRAPPPAPPTNQIELIEYNNRSYYFCPGCSHMHPRNPDIDYPTNFRPGNLTGCALTNGYLHGGPYAVPFPQNGPRLDQERRILITHHHVRLAINFNRWGPQFGIPLSAFDYSATEGLPATIDMPSLRPKLRTQAKIIADELYLYSSVSFTVELHEVDTLFLKLRPGQPLTAANRYQVFTTWLVERLPHIVVGHAPDTVGHTGLQQILEFGLQSGGFRQRSGCRMCETDWTTRFKPSKPTLLRNAIDVRIKTWRLLGDGRATNDPNWIHHSMHGVLSSPHAFAPRARADGVLRQTFKAH